MTPEELEKERLFFESERKRFPELFAREPMIDDNETLKWVGIDGNIFGERPIGYIKLYPQDFIVEEIRLDESLSDVDVAPMTDDTSSESDGLTYYADLVKIGISTIAAEKKIAELLDIEEKNVSHAGIKDNNALTSQHISIRGLPDIQKFQKIQEDNFFLKNIKRGKGVINNGDLWGNRFVIGIRLPKALSRQEINKIEETIKEVEESGFWNFFYLQRFGTPRLLSHVLGLLLRKGEYENAVKTFLTYPAKRELPYFQNIRREIKNNWKNWQVINEKIKIFPYHFWIELKFINHLLQHNDDFLGALKTVPEQIRLWVYAYDCYLFNLKLSELIKIGEVPVVLPIITSFNPKDWEPYKEYIEAHSLKLPGGFYKDFPFIRIESRVLPTTQKIKIHNIKFLEKLIVFAFSLPKGSYATTFLMNFFALTSGLPQIPNISKEKIDVKELTELGSLKIILEKFKNVLSRRAETIENF